MIRKCLIVVTLIAFLATLLPLLTLPQDQTLVLFWMDRDRDLDYHWINQNHFSYEGPKFSIGDYYAIRLEEGYLSLWVYRRRPAVSRGQITTWWGPARSRYPIQNLAIGHEDLTE